ncbi:hypothetical protein AURDEDRAFT_131626 [Auricularia subglabra TFB-10046 SS5]|uniref:Ubiquitin-like protease family profile domain-containing protein n=1 Tax=Auricularia subglabra (strain TFB-10046 / SS5) TaxID=717982 RepID=J0LAV5_AURST|nr:hypothetical protein AURDEDRAFT_131626 [Auricularia subglabra TFB-10046 SS5]
MSRTEVLCDDEPNSDEPNSDDEGGTDDDDPFLDGAAPVNIEDEEPALPPILFREPRPIKDSQADGGLTKLVAAFEPAVPVPDSHDVFRGRSNGFSAIEVHMASLNALRAAEELDPHVMYAGLAALVEEFCSNGTQRERVAIFRHCDFVYWKDLGQVAFTLRAVTNTLFWNKEVVLVPIFEDLHWTLAIVYLRLGKIDFYDSSGDTQCWKAQAQSVADFMVALTDAARQDRTRNVWPRPAAWETRPLVMKSAPHQRTSAVDSGLWVLACAAVTPALDLRDFLIFVNDS